MRLRNEDPARDLNRCMLLRRPVFLPRHPFSGQQRLRLTGIRGALVIELYNAANRSELLRGLPFPGGPEQIGLMAAAPEPAPAGFGAQPAELILCPAVTQALHDERFAE